MNTSFKDLLFRRSPFQGLAAFGACSLLICVSGCGVEHSQELRAAAKKVQDKAKAKATPKPSKAGQAKDKAPLAAPASKAALDQGKAAPPGVRWTLIPQQSFVGIEVLKRTGEHYARFRSVTGHAVQSAKQWTGLEVLVDTKSLEADVPAFGAHVRSEQFLHVKRYPKAQFVSSFLRKDPGPKANRYLMEGELTMRGRSQKVSLPVDFVEKGRKMELKGSIPLKFRSLGMSQVGIANELIDGVELSLRLVFIRPKEAQEAKK